MDRVWLRRKFIPQAQATTTYTQEALFETEDEECEGYCLM